MAQGYPKKIKRGPGAPAKDPEVKLSEKQVFLVPPGEAEFLARLPYLLGYGSKSRMFGELFYAAIPDDDAVRALRDELGLPPIEEALDVGANH